MIHMLDLNKDWIKIDNDNEEKIYNNIRFVRPINSKTYSLFCEKCDNVISSTDDMKYIKSHNCCEFCYINNNYDKTN